MLGRKGRDAFPEHVGVLLHDAVLPVQPFLFLLRQRLEGVRECKGRQLLALFVQFFLFCHYSFLVWLHVCSFGSCALTNHWRPTAGARVSSKFEHHGGPPWLSSALGVSTPAHFAQ